MTKPGVYPSDGERCRDLPGFLRIVQGLRARWRKLNLPTQSDRARPYGEDRALWFRGQSDITWRLTPKILREEYRDANEAEIRLEFKSVGQPLTQAGVVHDEWHWYFLMQHYAAPTRLLDWTVNPLASLYFAVRDEMKQDGAVWVLDPWRWNRAHVKDLYGPAVAGWSEISGYLLELEEAFDQDNYGQQTSRKWQVAIEPSHIDRRIAAQGSKFVLFGAKKDMIESPTINRPKGGGGKHSILDRITIPKEAAVGLREALNQIGINERTMFPDLEGLGKHIAWEWKSRITPKGKQKATRRHRFLRNPKAPSTK